jgi:hypothetical protein
MSDLPQYWWVKLQLAMEEDLVFLVVEDTVQGDQNPKICCCTKINEFNLTLFCNNQVLRLYIPVNNAGVMNFLKRCNDLLDDQCISFRRVYIL